MSELDRTNESGTDLVFKGPDGEPFTTSLVIASQTGNEHASVIKIVRDNLDDLNEIGRVRFQIAPFETAGGTQRREVAELDEPAAALLMTYLRNSPVVKEFKKRLVRDFYRMRTMLAGGLDLSDPIAAIEKVREREGRAIEIARAERARAERAELEAKVLTAAIERTAPLVAKAEAHTGSDSDVHRQEFAREVQAWGVKQNVDIKQADVLRFLGHIGLFIRGERSDTGHATADAQRRGLAFTHKDTAKNGYAYAVGKLTPAGQDYAWRRITKYVDEHGTLELPRELRGGEPA